MKTPSILAAALIIGALCANANANTNDQPAAVSMIETWVERYQASLSAKTNPFTGRYCGTLGALNTTITIGKKGRVSGTMFRAGPTSYRATFSGKVNKDGELHANMVATITRRGSRGSRERSVTSTRRISATAVVQRDQTGALAGTWQYLEGRTSPFTGTIPFVVSPCP